LFSPPAPPNASSTRGRVYKRGATPSRNGVLFVRPRRRCGVTTTPVCAAHPGVNCAGGMYRVFWNVRVLHTVWSVGPQRFPAFRTGGLDTRVLPPPFGAPFLAPYCPLAGSPNERGQGLAPQGFLPKDNGDRFPSNFAQLWKGPLSPLMEAPS